VRVAILDVDGTLFPGSIGLCLLDAIVKRGMCDAARADAVYESVARHRKGVTSYDEMARTATAAYASLLRGLPQAAVTSVAAEVWSQERERLFPFVRPLIRVLSSAGFVPMVMSSSPSEIIAWLAADLGVENYRGAQFTAVDGLFVGSTDVTLGESDSKLRLLKASFPEGSLDLDGSFAMGNSPNDIGLLSRVGHPVAFEPDLPVRALAAERGWFVGDRHTILDHVTTIAGWGRDVH
jgi:phosphoserine phosphatase